MSDDEGFIVEFTPMGAFVRVSAMDPASLREAVIVGAASASQGDLARLAARKLRYILNREHGD